MPTKARKRYGCKLIFGGSSRLTPQDISTCLAELSCEVIPHFTPIDIDRPINTTPDIRSTVRATNPWGIRGDAIWRCLGRSAGCDRPEKNQAMKIIEHKPMKMLTRVN